MKFKKAAFISAALIGLLLIGVTSAQQIGVQTDSITMTGVFNDNRMTGWFTKSEDAAKEPSWFVFVGGDNKVYKARIESERIAELYRDGVMLNDPAAYPSATEKFLNNLKLNNELDRKEAALGLKETELEKEEDELNTERNKLERKIEKLDRLAEKSSADLSAERTELQKIQKQIDAAERELENRANEIDAAQDKIDASRDTLDDGMDRLFKVLDAITADLRADGIISGKNGLSFKLSTTNFIVNGKPVTGAIYDRYRAKYILQTAAESGFVYNWKGKF